MAYWGKEGRRGPLLQGSNVTRDKGIGAVRGMPQPARWMAHCRTHVLPDASWEGTTALAGSRQPSGRPQTATRQLSARAHLASGGTR